MTVKKDPMSISNSESRTAEASPRKEHSTALRAGSVGVMGILFFVLSAQAPLTGIVGASPLAAALGNGAGAPGAYLVVGIVIVIFAVGFVAMSRKIQANGAFYAYVTAAFGRKVGAGAAWLALLAYSTVQAAMYGLYGAAFSGLLGSAGMVVPWWLLAAVTMAGVQVLGSLNIELGARVLAVLVGLEVAILLMFGFTVLLRGGGPEGISLAASFSPAAIGAGAPGVAIMFAVASMFGFESTAIYSAEAKDAHRTVARATYLSVVVIAVFFSFISWMLVSYYGPSHVIDAAGAALESQLLQRVRRLEPQQPAADHGAGAARVVGRPGGDRLQVLDGAVDEAPGQIAPGNGWHERRRPGREDQVVVRDLAAVDLDDPARAIDSPPARREADRESGGLVLPGTHQREILRRLAVEERRQADAIVGEPRFLTEHRHIERRPPGRGDPLPEKLEEPVADHAVADDDQSIAHTALHASQPSGRPVSRWSSHGQMSVYERYR